MKKNEFTPEQNNEILFVCCIIFVYYLPKRNYFRKNEPSLEDICQMITDNNWDKLFKCERWLESLTKALAENLPHLSINHEGICLDTLVKYFLEMEPIMVEADRIRNFRLKKPGDKMPFSKLPLRTHFCLLEDEIPDKPGMYQYHYAKDDDTHAHHIIGPEKKIKVEPQTVVVYVPVAGP